MFMRYVHTTLKCLVVKAVMGEGMCYISLLKGLPLYTLDDVTSFERILGNENEVRKDSK